MISLLEVITKTSKFFQEKGIENPKLNSERIVGHALGMKRMDLYLEFERPLIESEVDKIRALVKRRATREPLQYIEGTTDFFNITLSIGTGVLIPRPETEELIDILINKKKVSPKSILDIGTGSGAIALSLAKHYPKAKVTATDISREALKYAWDNAKALELEDQITFIHCPVYEKITGTFDLIVSNPPYLTEEEFNTAEPEVKLFEPREALTTENGGLKILESIIAGAATHMHSDSLLALETGIDQMDKLRDIANSNTLPQNEALNDFTERPRYFFAKK